MVGGLFVCALAVGLWWFSQEGGPPPTVAILEPEKPLPLTSGQGFVLLAEGQSARGVQRIDFLVDGAVAQQRMAEARGEPTLQAAFPWFASALGPHTLSVIAYDARGQASEPAALPVGVEAMVPEYRQAELPVPGTGEEPTAAEPGAGAEEGGPGEAPPGAEEAPPHEEEGEEGPQIGPQLGEEEAPPEGPDVCGPPEEAVPGGPEDAAPSLTLDVAFVRQGEGGVADILAVAESDIGLDWIELTFVNEAGRGERPLQRFCDGASPCEFPLELPVEAGQWWFTAQAVDTEGQASEPQTRFLEAGGDPLAVAVHGELLDLIGGLGPFEILDPVDLVGPFAGFAPGELPIFESPEDLELQSFELKGCLIVQPVVIPGGPFTDCPRWDLRGVDLSDLDLRYASFQGTDLRGANLSGAKLEGAFLWGAKLQGADLSRTDLTGAELGLACLGDATLDDRTQIANKWLHVWQIATLGAQAPHRNDLTGVDFRWACLTGANLADATLASADLRQADLSNAVALGANLRGVRASNAILRDIDLRGFAVLQYGNFLGADLSGAFLQGADLSRADLRFADLPGAHLQEATLDHANLRHADLSGADLTEADLDYARLHRSIIDDSTQMDPKWRAVWYVLNTANWQYHVGWWNDFARVNLEGADLSNHSGISLVSASFEHARLDGVNFSGSNLRFADFGQAVMQDANLSWADLRDATLRSANLRDANLSGANLTGADLHGALLLDVVWSNTTCPDGTNSDDHDDTCEGHLGPPEPPEGAEGAEGAEFRGEADWEDLLPWNW